MIKYNKLQRFDSIPENNDDVYILTTLGDRLDKIAYEFYNDEQLYKLIMIANNNITKGSITPEPGLQLRIPTNIDVINNFKNKINNVDIQSKYR